MRLKGLLAIITGASGGIGQVISKKFLEEGAEVIGTGRDVSKLEALSKELGSEKFHYVVMDATNLDSIIAGIQLIRKKFGKIDILVNNAGSAGPMEILPNIPLVNAKETLQDALESLLGFPWIMTCALYQQFQKGASIINVSSIFSRFNYYGRTAYTVPKAALNELGHIMAEELGSLPTEIRVNTVFPGPVESERIYRVFKAMDELKGVSPGTTEKEITSQMVLKGPPFVSKEDVVNTIIYLASHESNGISNQEFEVAHGLQVPKDNTIEISLSPNPKIVNLDGYYTWIIGGSEIEIAALIAQKHYDKGSKILLTFRDIDAMKEASAQFQDLLNFTVKLFDPTNAEDWKIMGRAFSDAMYYPGNVFVLPHHSNDDYLDQYGDSVSRMPLEKIQDYLISEIGDAIIAARFMAKTFSPSIIFVSNGSDGRGNKFNRIRSAAIEQLIRTWRYEVQGPIKIWQLIRYGNEQHDNMNFTANLAISISAGITKTTHINFSIAKSTQQPPFEFTYNQKYHQMLGNLDNTVALITGGSEGIGRETARIMVQGGALVGIASRSMDKLNKTKKFLVKELTANGFPEAETRIFTLELDVTKEKSIEIAFNEFISKNGGIDYLVNNAGIVGQEQMIFDMDVDGWRSTLQANLCSNYHLMILSLPYMKKQNKGSIVNISSAFGGEKYATPSYPIRADYAVTKSGQRALAENFATLIGPVVKINTVAPGPVEGDRVRGSETRPGLYLRRAKINAENKRVNQIYDSLIEVWRKDHDLIPILNKEGPKYPLTKKLLEKLLKRLKLGGYLSESYVLEGFQERNEELFSEQELEKSANAISSRAIKMLALQRMPSEYDIGREVVFNVVSNSVTGETLYPSCGLIFEQVALSGDFSVEFYPTLYQELKVKTVLVIGNSMLDVMEHVIDCFKQAPSVEKVIVINEYTENKFEEVPDVVISFPMGPLPEGEELPSIEGFNKIIEEHLTNHFQIGRRASLIDNCRIFFVTHAVDSKASKQKLMFSKFLGSTLSPLTVTAGQECTRIIHQSRFYQINSNPYTDISIFKKKLGDTLLLHSMPMTIKPISGQIINI